VDEERLGEIGFDADCLRYDAACQLPKYAKTKLSRQRSKSNSMGGGRGEARATGLDGNTMLRERRESGGRWVHT